MFGDKVCTSFVRIRFVLVNVSLIAQLRLHYTLIGVSISNDFLKGNEDRGHKYFSVMETLCPNIYKRKGDPRGTYRGNNKWNFL